MKPESRGSFLNRSFRRSFRKKKNENKEKANTSVNQAEEQEKAFIEFKKVVSNITEPRHTEVILHRFLKAKKFNVSEAEKLLQLEISFKKFLLPEEENMTEREIKKYLNKSTIIGPDKEGCLIRVVRLGKMDLKGLVHSLSTIAILKNFIRIIDIDSKQLQEENKKNGKNASQFIYIFDLEGLTTSQILHKPVLDSAMMGIQKIQEQYFELWKSVYIINAPSYFSSVFKLLKPAMIEELYSKITVYGADYKDALLEQIDAEVLPDFLGGTRVDYMDNAQFIGLISEYTPIPNSLHASSKEFLNPDDPATETVTVSPGGFVNIPIPVILSKSYINFHLNTKDNDIGIAVYFEPNATVCHIEKYKKKVNPKDILSKLEQLTPHFRSQCHIKPEIGTVFAWRSGVYMLHIDNTYSWMNSKQIYYKIEVTPPELKKATPDVVQKNKSLLI